MADRTDVVNALSRIYRGRRTVALSSGAISGYGSAWGANSPNVPFDSAGALNALSPSKLKLQTESADVNWLVVGDSTANETTEWHYLWFADLAARYPAFTFVYYAPDGSGGYAAPVTVQTGSGARTIRLYCNGVSGVLSYYLMGSLFTGAFVTPARSWDLIIWNYGKNHVSGASQYLVEGEFLGSIAQAQLAFPAANHLLVNQYPNRDDANMALANTCWLDIAANDTSLALLDLYSGTSYVSGDYADNQHLTSSANAAKLLPLCQALWTATRAGARAAGTPWLQTAALNLLNGDSNEAYGDFSLNGNGTTPGAAAVTPGGWALSGTVAFTQEATIVYSPATRSQKMQGSGAALARIRRTATATKLALAKGNWITLTVLLYVPSGSATTVGRQGLFTDGTGGAANQSRSGGAPFDGWRVQVLGPVFLASDATFVRHDNYHDSAAAPDATHPTYTQYAHLSIGKLPRIVNT